MALDYFWMVNYNLVTLLLDQRGKESLTADVIGGEDVH